jgi:hypothetical protein
MESKNKSLQRFFNRVASSTPCITTICGLSAVFTAIACGATAPVLIGVSAAAAAAYFKVVIVDGIKEQQIFYDRVKTELTERQNIKNRSQAHKESKL